MDKLEANKDVLGQELYDLCVEAYDEWDQKHLFNFWPGPGTDDAKKISMAKQLSVMNAQYPGGLIGYINNAKKLLEDSKLGLNPFEGFTPVVPTGERLSLQPYNEENLKIFDTFESKGMEIVGKACFVIVAGGLGERLGYSGIKLGLPTTILTMDCYLKLYCDNILALQARARALSNNDGIVIPLAIMTSDDTHEKTVELLSTHNNFGLATNQITIMKQEKVPALLNNSAHFALEEKNKFEIETKPHGHGDVHSLLYKYELIKNWVEDGRKYVCFLQDTNALVFRALVAALGVSETNDFYVNSMSVPRKPKEAVGAICKLVNKEKGLDLTVNVEYNQLDPLLKATINPKGDVADPNDSNGYSPFPGNINVLVFKLAPYKAVLDSTKGMVPEFVNPKYADEAKTTFKKATRLECMMQDYPKLLVGRDDAKHVGFTQIDRFIGFSAVKNNLVEAKEKLALTGFAESASSGESDIFSTNRHLLKIAGVNIEVDESVLPYTEFKGLRTLMGAKIILMPSFGVTIQEIRKRFKSPEKVKISNKSSVILEGDVEIEEMEIDGAVYICGKPGSGKVLIKKLVVKNDGVEFKQIEGDKREEEILEIRGYTLKGNPKMKEIICEEGEKVVDENALSTGKPKESTDKMTSEKAGVKCCC